MNQQSLQKTMLRWAEVLAVFLAALVVTARPMFSGLATPLHRNILVHLLVFMAALLATLVLTLRKRLEVRAPAVTALLLAFLATTAVAACFAGYRYAAVVRALDIAAWCVLAVVLIQLFSNPFRARILLAGVVATLAVLAVNGLYQFFVTLPEIRTDLPEHIQRMIDSGALRPELADTFVKRATSGDVFGTFVTANSFAGLLALLLPAAFASAVVLWREKKPRVSAASIVVAAAALAGLATLALTRSKGGMLALALALGAWAAMTVIGRVRRGPAAAIAAVLFVAVLLTAQAAPETHDAPPPRHTSVLGDSAEVRIEYWKAGIGMFEQHPWLGVGPGNFAECYPAFRTPEGSETRYAHNDFLETACEQGAIGFLVFAGVWVAWFAGMRRRAPAFATDHDEDAKGRRLFAVVIGAVGPAAIFFAMSPFVPTGETRAMTAVGILVWLVVYVAQARHILSLDNPARTSALLRAAATAGVLALLLHAAIDFDFNEPGVVAPLAGMLAAGLGLRGRSPEEAKGKAFGPGGQLALVGLIAAPLALALVLLLYPLIDMSIALEQARGIRSESSRALADPALSPEAKKKAEEALKVEYPRLLKEAIRSWPGNTEPYMEFARMEAAALGSYSRAGGEWSDHRFRLGLLLLDAKKRAPCDPAPWVLMAEMLQSQVKAAEAGGDASTVKFFAEAALEEIDGALARYPTQPKMRLMKARLLDTLGRRGEAVEEYRRALDFAERTSEKELKFSPEESRDIRQAIARLETPAPNK